MVNSESEKEFELCTSAKQNNNKCYDHVKVFFSRHLETVINLWIKLIMINTWISPAGLSVRHAVIFMYLLFSDTRTLQKVRKVHLTDLNSYCMRREPFLYSLRNHTSYDICIFYPKQLDCNASLQIKYYPKISPLLFVFLGTSMYRVQLVRLVLFISTSVCMS